MPEVSLKRGDNLELKISLDINLQIFNGYYFNSDILNFKNEKSLID